MGSVEFDLRQHENEMERGEQFMEMATVRATEEAREAVGDDKTVTELIYEYELDPSICLARCFRNLDSACKGEHIGMDAITTALHILRESMIAKQTDNTVEEVYEELRGWR